MNPKTKTVACPHCGELTEFSSSNPHRPFCSERCQLIDLGDWADEKFRIPEPEKPHNTVNQNFPEDSDLH